MALPRLITTNDAVINARDFGASTTASDNAAALTAAISAAVTGGRSSVYIPAGDYTCLSAVTIPDSVDGLTIFGDGPGITRLLFTAATNGIDCTPATSVYQLTLRDMSLVGDDVDSLTGLRCDLTYHSVLERLDVTGWTEDGIKLTSGFYNLVQHCRSYHNARHGLVLGYLANAVTVVGGHYRYNGQCGVLVAAEDAVSVSQHNDLIAVTTEQNGRANLEIDGSDYNTVTGGYSESDWAAAIAEGWELDHAANTPPAQWVGGVVVGSSTAHNATGNVIIGRLSYGADAAPTLLVDKADYTCVTNGVARNGITITADATGTRIRDLADVQGAVSDSGDSTVFASPRDYATTNYIRGYGTGKKWEVRYGGVETAVNVGSNDMVFEAAGLGEVARLGSTGLLVGSTRWSAGKLLPGSYALAANEWHVQYKRLQLTGTQRLTLASTARQIVTDL